MPVSGVCLILDDINKPLLNDIGGAINFDMTGDTGVMLGDIVEKCFNPVDVSAPANLMDILFQRNVTTGDKETLRERTIDKFKEEINSKFKVLTNKLNMELPRLSQDPRFIELQNVLANNPVDRMMLPNEALTSRSEYKALAVDSLLKRAALNSSASCHRHYASFTGQAVGGISDLLFQLEALGTKSTLVPNGLSCTKTVTCNAGSSFARCEAGNKLMKLKASLQSTGAVGPTGSISQNKYRCDDFLLSGTMNTVSVQCNLTEFVTYISDFSTRIEQVFTRVDQEVDAVKTTIDVNLRQILDKHISDPLGTIANHMQCNFLAPVYADVVDSLCYQGMWGVRNIASSYVILGFLQVLVILLMYTWYKFGTSGESSADEHTTK